MHKFEEFGVKRKLLASMKNQIGHTHVQTASFSASLLDLSLSDQTTEIRTEGKSVRLAISEWRNDNEW